MHWSRQNHVMRQIAVALPIAVALAPGNGLQASGAFTEPARIREAAERYVAELANGRGNVHATAGHLDARLRLPTCAGELTPFLSPGAVVRARTTVGVRCVAPAWSVYLPVSVESEAPVLVARRALRRGEVPLAADFDLQRRRVPGLATAFVTEPDSLGGQRLRRAMAAGEPLAAILLESPPLVRRGQSVTAVSRAAGIEVRSAAEAMANAGAGDRLRLRNPSTGRLLDGTVQPDGTVEILP
jgi:flagella basal body P-ring formation protein FlgA